ncbi:nucleoside triphosphate pyrophosphohydrolase [Halobacterium litoreum]|uniref:Phosphoribosyl-ATP pyrophosphohydrolase n=1 Tax=Halobacterium litoreum TaxID=2039234 RepID=A0ABD5NI73_9EURY|nr:nucleoside triphosphate pyrophosphohydrolase [Halobacterium litoreum]UHH12304.1 nucleoside triphosphate pyrophosphohydrolase [Halobacterium litoreum]
MTREYDKLVRDDIPAKIRADDETPVTHRATGDEYRDRLAEKLVEEAEEYAENRRVAELGDVLDVLDAICVARDVDRDRLDDARETKKEERGGFAEGVVLERVEE